MGGGEMVSLRFEGERKGGVGVATAVRCTGSGVTAGASVRGGGWWVGRMRAR